MDNEFNEGDVLETKEEKKREFMEEVDTPKEFTEKGVPLRLEVLETDFGDTHVTQHLVEQVFDKHDNTEHPYSHKVLEGLIDKEILEFKDE